MFNSAAEDFKKSPGRELRIPEKERPGLFALEKSSLQKMPALSCARSSMEGDGALFASFP